MLSLCHVCLITNGAPRFSHVTHEEEASHNAHRSLFIERLKCCHASLEVHRVHLTSTVITP